MFSGGESVSSGWDFLHESRGAVHVLRNGPWNGNSDRMNADQEKKKGKSRFSFGNAI